MLSFRPLRATPPPNVVMSMLGGLPAGTEVLTLDGAVPVEFVTPLCSVLTRRGGALRVAEIRLDVRPVALVQLRPRALGVRSPARAVTLPAEQLVQLRGHRAVALFGRECAEARLGDLIDGDRVVDLGQRTTFVHILAFDRPQVIYAGGIEVVTPAASTLPILPQ
ncbi:MAG: Hint domain-containing protein [Rhodobacteraceae bacterium]|nr:Hint domain-containing protein [Paracoccaceae bacterium]